MVSFGRKFVLPDIPPVPHRRLESFVFANLERNQ